MIHISKKFLIIFGLLVAVLFFIWLWLGPSWLIILKLKLAPYSGSYYAVYLDNGQVLYGQVLGVAQNLMRLTNIYYIQTVTAGETTTNNLIRRGVNEISRPTNELFVNRDHILYWEKVGPDAPVMKIIKKD